MKQFTNREKAILAGLYLSKFSEEGLRLLGFSSYTEAYNVLGLSVHIAPNSVKGYRDEFDPYTPNSRIGRQNRPIREYCKKIWNDFGHLDLNAFTDLINSIVIENYETEKFVNQIEKRDWTESIAKRLITGSSAEEYFKEHYKAEQRFIGYDVSDTRSMACGFDFKLIREQNFYCVEVKGLDKDKGGITLTEKEFNIAKALKERYCLYIVKNFAHKPRHEILFDPMNSRLSFNKRENTIVQVSYSAIV